MTANHMGTLLRVAQCHAPTQAVTLPAGGLRLTAVTTTGGVLLHMTAITQVHLPLVPHRPSHVTLLTALPQGVGVIAMGVAPPWEGVTHTALAQRVVVWDSATELPVPLPPAPPWVAVLVTGVLLLQRPLDGTARRVETAPSPVWVMGLRAKRVTVRVRRVVIHTMARAALPGQQVEEGRGASPARAQSPPGSAMPAAREPPTLLKLGTGEELGGMGEVAGVVEWVELATGPLEVGLGLGHRLLTVQVQHTGMSHLQPRQVDLGKMITLRGPAATEAKAVPLPREVSGVKGAVLTALGASHPEVPQQVEAEEAALEGQELTKRECQWGARVMEVHLQQDTDPVPRVALRS